jgi:Regulator of ribonuclease activity B
MDRRDGYYRASGDAATPKATEDPVGFLKRPQADKPAQETNPDVLAVEKMRRDGADPTVTHLTRHFLYVPGVKAAADTARALKTPGRRIEVDTSARTGFWLVVVEQSMLVTPESIAELRREFEAVVQPKGGIYDRWQVEVAGG